MTLRQLKAFDAIGKYLNMSRAAVELGVTQPGISRQMRLLQNECKTKLYDISAQGIKLTYEGRQLLAAVRPVLRNMEDIERRFVEVRRNSPHKCLRIGGSESCSVSVVPNAIAAFREIYPEVRIVLLTGDSKTVERKLLNSEVEIGLVTECPDNPTIVAEPLCSERVVAVASISFPLPKKRIFKYNDLSAVPFLKKQGGRITQQIERAGISLNFIMECESHNAVRLAVASGLGIGFFAYDEVEDDLRRPSLKVVHISDLKEVDFRRFIAYRQGEPLSLEAQHFLKILNKQSNRRTKNQKRFQAIQARRSFPQLPTR